MKRTVRVFLLLVLSLLVLMGLASRLMELVLKSIIFIEKVQKKMWGCFLLFVEIL